jgi:purine-binding chemotaxis protein CheW
MTSPESHSAGRTAQLAVFQVGEYTCGLRIEDVYEINRKLHLTPVHEAPESIRGILDLRGNVVTVIDLARRLGLPPTEVTRTTRNVIVKCEQEIVGLLVDGVDDIVEIDEDAVLPTPPHLQKELGRAFLGVIPFGDDLVAILDISQVLSDSGRT